MYIKDDIYISIYISHIPCLFDPLNPASMGPGHSCGVACAGHLGAVSGDSTFQMNVASQC